MRNKARHDWVIIGIMQSCTTKNNVFKLLSKNFDIVQNIRHKQYSNKLGNLINYAKYRHDQALFKKYVSIVRDYGFLENQTFAWKIKKPLR